MTFHHGYHKIQVGDNVVSSSAHPHITYSVIISMLSHVLSAKEISVYNIKANTNLKRENDPHLLRFKLDVKPVQMLIIQIN